MEHADLKQSECLSRSRITRIEDAFSCIRRDQGLGVSGDFVLDAPQALKIAWRRVRLCGSCKAVLQLIEYTFAMPERPSGALSDGRIEPNIIQPFPELNRSQ